MQLYIMKLLNLVCMACTLLVLYTYTRARLRGAARGEVLFDKYDPTIQPVCGHLNVYNIIFCKSVPCTMLIRHGDRL